MKPSAEFPWHKKTSTNHRRVPTSRRLQGKCARITCNLSQAASGMTLTLQNHRRLSVSIFSVNIAASGSMKLFYRSKLKF
jgi:hypothetical protein